jgi:hypothetical protein
MPAFERKTMMERVATMTGGCQCGTVRYALSAEPTQGSICHCRMCQKASGNFFAPLAGVKIEELTWTRGEPAIFKSSELVERGFCRDCGTPLTFRYLDRDRIMLMVGSLDEPARVAIDKQYGIESRLPTFATLHRLPGATSDDGETPERLAKLASRQHPDHDEGRRPLDKT